MFFLCIAKESSPFLRRGSPIGFTGSGNLEKEGSEMRDGYYERDSGIGDFKGQDPGNNHLNEPRAGKSVDANFKSRKV